MMQITDANPEKYHEEKRCRGPLRLLGNNVVSYDDIPNCTYYVVGIKTAKHVRANSGCYIRNGDARPPHTPVRS